MKICAIDFETANRSMASICSIGVSTYEDGVVEDPYASLIHPAENVNWFEPVNISIHGITPAMVADAPDWRQVYEELDPIWSGAVLCAHNAKFDMTCLRRSNENCGLPAPHFTYFDTVELSRHAFPEMPHHTLDAMCTRLGIELDHHKADSDAHGCLMIMVRLMELTGIYDETEFLSYFDVHLRHL